MRFHLVVFQIPSRPLGTADPLDGRYLMRSGSALAPMSEDRLRRVFAEGKLFAVLGVSLIPKQTPDASRSSRKHLIQLQVLIPKLTAGEPQILLEKALAEAIGL